MSIKILNELYDYLTSVRIRKTNLIEKEIKRKDGKFRELIKFLVEGKSNTESKLIQCKIIA